MTAAVRWALAFALVAHGVAHGVGFAVPWRLITPAEMPYKTTILAGRIDVGAGGIKAIGLVWLAIGLACAAAGIAVASRAVALTSPVVVAVLAASTFMCLLEWPEARIGLFLNLILFAIVFVLRSR